MHVLFSDFPVVPEADRAPEPVLHGSPSEQRVVGCSLMRQVRGGFHAQSTVGASYGGSAPGGKKRWIPKSCSVHANTV